MNKLDCQIVKDLLPLYIDKVCSEESMNAVEEHLRSCPICEADLTKLQATPDIAPAIDEDIESAVKKVNKRIKKSKKKAVVKTLSITLSILLVIGLISYLIIPVKVAYSRYCDEGYLYAQCNLLDIDISNNKKSNFQGKHANVYINKALGKYKTEETQDGEKLIFEDGKTLVIAYIPTIKEYVKPFYEEHGIFGIGGWHNFPFFNPIIKKGIEYMGVNPDTVYTDLSIYSKLLKSSEESWTEYAMPLNPKEFAMWYTYYALYINIMPVGMHNFGYYIHAENDTLHGWGWSGYNEENGNRYVLQLQPKGEIYDNYNFIFTGFQREEMIEIAESIVLK